METKPRIIPIAAGKGGVGKTFITANLAIALAELGYKTVALDLDLGGSNLHSFLGLSNKFPGIGDFLKARSCELNDLLIDTGTKDLQFIPGDGRTPFLANIPFAQKVRLIKHLRKLSADYLLLDLGAGTSFNTLDFFRLSKNGVMVITPEYPSIMSMLSFLKHFMLRTIERMFAREHEILEMIRKDYFKRSSEDNALTIDSLIEMIKQVDVNAAKKVDAVCRSFRPRIIFNMGDEPDEIEIAGQINKSLKSMLNMACDYFGFIRYDRSVRESVKGRNVYLPLYRDNMAARDIIKTAERVNRFFDKPIENSAALLLRNTKKLYNNRS